MISGRQSQGRTQSLSPALFDLAVSNDIHCLPSSDSTLLIQTFGRCHDMAFYQLLRSTIAGGHCHINMWELIKGLARMS